MSVIPDSDLIELYNRYNIYPYDLNRLLTSLYYKFNQIVDLQDILVIKKYYSAIDVYEQFYSKVKNTSSNFNVVLLHYFPEIMMFLETWCVYWFLYYEVNNDSYYQYSCFDILKNIHPLHRSHIINNLIEHTNEKNSICYMKENVCLLLRLKNIQSL